LEKLSLDAFELVFILADFFFHNLGRSCCPSEVVLGRLSIVKFTAQVKLIINELISLEGTVRVEDDGHPL